MQNMGPPEGSLGFIAFGELAPDRPDILNVGVEDVDNVIARERGYYPKPLFSAYSAALASRPVGAFTTVDKNGTRYMYAATQANLYALAGTAWTDISRVSPAYTNATRWEFLKWGETLQAWAKNNNPQTIALGGTNFVDLTTTLQAGTAAVVRQQVMVGNTFDSTDGEQPSRVRWCHWQDAASWTVSKPNLSDYQDLRNSGPVQRIIGGEFALIFCSGSIHRATFVGAPYVYQIDRLETGPGTESPDSVIRYGNLVYFFSDDGFRVTDGGGQSRLLGSDRVNLTVLNQLDSTYLTRVVAAPYPAQQSIVWAYPGSGHTSGRPNMLVLYNYASDRWAFGDEVVEFIASAAVPFQSMDDLDSEFPDVDVDMDGSLDGGTFAGGNERLGLFNSAYRLGFRDGADATGTVTTGEAMMTPGRRAFLSGVRVGVEGDASVRCRVGHRNSLNDPLVWSAWSMENAEGVCPLRVDNRYFRFEVEVSGGYDYIYGLEPLGHPSSAR